MKHGSLFSGIGGFDLAAEWMGWENVFHCEWNEFCQKVLKYYFPKSLSYHDITKTDFTIHRGQIDLISGGFPCQPYSTAGKRKGKEDERHLWPEMLRAIREIQPRWIVGENVFGLINWNGGMVFNEVQTDLEAEGYEVFPYVLPAVSVNAPHKRDRVFFIAFKNTISDGRIFREPTKEGTKIWQQRDTCTGNSHGFCGAKVAGITTDTKGEGRRELTSEDSGGEDRRLDNDGSIQYAPYSNSLRLEQCENRTEMEGGQSEMGEEGSQFTNATQTNGKVSDATDTNSKGLQRRPNSNGRKEYDKKGGIDGSNIGAISENNSRHSISDFSNFPTVSPICNGDDGLSNRLDSITFPKWRTESIKAGGNAVVPQVVHQIFKAIQQFENLNSNLF